VSRGVVSVGPVDKPPSGHRDQAERLAVLRNVLVGVPLGAYDERVLEWLAASDWPTVATVASLSTRTRQAAGQP
jgi:hypothetical protein